MLHNHPYIWIMIIRLHIYKLCVSIFCIFACSCLMSIYYGQAAQILKITHLETTICQHHLQHKTLNFLVAVRHNLCVFFIFYVVKSNYISQDHTKPTGYISTSQEPSKAVVVRIMRLLQRNTHKPQLFSFNHKLGYKC